MLLLFNIVNSLLADYQALRWPQNLLLDNKVCLPALHALLIILELGGARLHSVDMLKVMLEVLYDIFFLQLFPILEILKSFFFDLNLFWLFCGLGGYFFNLSI